MHCHSSLLLAVITMSVQQDNINRLDQQQVLIERIRSSLVPAANVEPQHKFNKHSISHHCHHYHR